MDKRDNNLNIIADTLLEYLHDVIYDSKKSLLDFEKLPDEFHHFGEGLSLFSNWVIETINLAKELAKGNLNCSLPKSDNEISSPLKSLHASLRHLTWQTQQVANGDYNQRVDFMGDFSIAFNDMVKKLDHRWKVTLDEKSKLERHVNLMLTNFTDLILLFDKEKNLIYVSESFLTICEIDDISMILGKQITDLFNQYTSESFTKLLENTFDFTSQERRTIEIEYDIAFNGPMRSYQIQITAMLDKDDNTEGIMVLLHDTTDIINARIEAERARELAERSSQAKSNFLARMSHEMRTPMSAIIGMTSIFNSTDDLIRKNYCIEKIDEASKHLLSVINNILDMSKIEANHFVISFNTFNFRKSITNIIDTMRFRISEKKQEIIINIDTKIPKVLTTDEKHLMQVLTNLFFNAIKFTPDGGKISLLIDMISEDSTFCIIRFTVKDNGIGISKEQQKQLFIPFEQAERGVARKFDGTGLGLAISKHIIELLDGKIWVESDTNKGASFIFEIPIEKVVTIDTDESQDKNKTLDSDDNIFIDKKVLIVEDIEINREILISLLEHTGIQIEQATDGYEALIKFTAEPESYDFILMDLNMPNMDGYEATRKIRSLGLLNSATIPIVAITANTFQEDVEACLACGMNSHLSKPVDSFKLIEQLKEYLLLK